MGAPSSSQLPPHCSLAQGPDTRVELLLPEGTLWGCPFSAACDPLAFAARKGKRRGLPQRFPRASGHLKGRGGGGTISYLFRQEAIISSREETFFEFLTQISAKLHLPLGPPCSFLPFLWTRSSSWQRLPLFWPLALGPTLRAQRRECGL